MRHAIGVATLAGMVALGAGAQSQSGQNQQSQPTYQSVAPKKPAPKPLDPADVETLTGRPVSRAVTALPQRAGAQPAAENGEEPSADKRPPVNPVDVDILTGKYDRNRSDGQYRGSPGWEALWAAEWMERRGYRGHDESFFRLDGIRHDQRFFFHHRGFGHRGFGFGRGHFPRHFLRHGSFFFFLP